jgi:hypothetical protein
MNRLKMDKIQMLGDDTNITNDIHDEIKIRLNLGNACYHSVQTLLSSRLISKNPKIKFCQLCCMGAKLGLSF